jgi:hypothetical protein
LLRLVQECSHRFTVVPDGIWNPIHQAKLRWYADQSSLVLGHEHWLPLVADLQVVGLVEVFGHADFLTVSHIEESVAGTKIEFDVIHDISLLDAIVGYDAGSNEFLSALILEFVNGSCRIACISHHIIIQLVDSVEHSFGGHESRAAVDDQSTTRLILVSCGFESVPNLHLKLVNVHWTGGVEELWPVAELEKSSLAHCLLDDDVQDLAHCLAVLSLWVLDVSCVYDVFTLMLDQQCYLLAHELGAEKVALSYWLSRPDVETGVNELADHELDSLCFSLDDFGNLKWRIWVC